MVPLYKGKGSQQCCDDYRRLLLANHASKASVGLIKGRIDPLYKTKISPSQFGAVPGRGADLATNAVRSMLSFAFQMSWSLCMVFIDLPKAFNKIVRAHVVGWPDHLHLPASRDVRMNYLTSMGVPCRAASHNHDYLTANGCLFEQ